MPSCEIRENWAIIEGSTPMSHLITTHAVPTKRVWAEDKGFEFPILSDYWLMARMQGL